MKNRILKHFEKITSIPRCSFNASQMFEELVRFGKEKGFDVFTDEYNNVLCKKGNPKICLQAHYDMVCLGDAPKIEIVHHNTLLKAKNSTLGADDGMGMAIMFCMMEDYSDIECLFTSEEEVGLIGATNLKMELSSNKILNLDGESEEEIYIGCAGGIEIIATCKPKIKPLDAPYKIYKVSVDGLKGGHSGVDIDKNIPSAIKMLVNALMEYDVKLIDINGGEMRNSIPKSAYAIVASHEDLKDIVTKHIVVEEYQERVEGYFSNSYEILHVLNAFAQGVRAYEKDFMIPQTSINMGQIRRIDNHLVIDCNARSLSDKELSILTDETCSLFELAGFEVKTADYHGAWNPDVAKFALLTKDIMSKYYKNVQLKAIHAGLECGALIQTQAKKIEAASIGPTIKYPHSLHEECDLNSVERIAYAVENIIQEVTK